MPGIPPPNDEDENELNPLFPNPLLPNPLKKSSSSPNPPNPPKLAPFLPFLLPKKLEKPLPNPLKSSSSPKLEKKCLKI